MNLAEFVGSGEQGRWDVEAERLRGLQIDDRQKFRQRLNGSFGQTISCLLLRYFIRRRILKN